MLLGKTDGAMVSRQAVSFLDRRVKGTRGGGQGEQREGTGLALRPAVGALLMETMVGGARSYWGAEVLEVSGVLLRLQFLLN